MNLLYPERDDGFGRGDYLEGSAKGAWGEVCTLYYYRRAMEYLKENFDLSIILISHDLDYVAKYADQVILLDQTVVKSGSAKDVFASEEFKEIFGGEELPGYVSKKRDRGKKAGEITWD